MRYLIYTLLAIASGVFCSCSRETEERETVLGYFGQAKRNPYLAAERYLKADGKQVTTLSGTLQFEADETLVVSPASSIRSVADCERLLDWVVDGGHFVCFLERGEDYFEDVGDWANHSPWSWSEEDEVNTGVEQLLKDLEVEVVVSPTERATIEESEESEDSVVVVEGKQYKRSVAMGEVLPYSEVVTVGVDEDGERSFTMQLGGERRMKPLTHYYVDDWYEAGETHRFLSRSYGDGRVTFLSDARAFRNPYLKLEQHAEMLDYLAEGDGKIVFSLGKVPGFLAMLFEQAWMALYGLLLLTVLWLWKNMPRFGPLLEVHDGHSRNYAELLSNSGKFLWRNKCDAALLQPLRDAVARQSGEPFAQSLDSQALVSKLSESSGIAPELVAEAMTRTDVRDANSMVRITKTLQSLLKSL